MYPKSSIAAFWSAPSKIAELKVDEFILIPILHYTRHMSSIMKKNLKILEEVKCKVECGRSNLSGVFFGTNSNPASMYFSIEPAKPCSFADGRLYRPPLV